MNNTMGKEASLDGLEFDGETVLCRVCGDKASGFHYGVHACEGCKGFFRRSIQQKIQYRPCLKNQQCNIMRVNRNRCQYCRLKKCISVGMSRDAVRFGRVPKKEKARIMEQMQKVNSQSVSSALAEILENESDLVQTVINSHKLTNEFTQERVQKLRQDAFQRNDFMTCPAHMACPLNVNADTDANDNKQRWEDFSEYFTPAIKCVVDFAKAIPGFQLLSQDDQVTLLKAGTFEVLLLRFVSLFDPVTNTMLFTNGKLFKRHQSSVSGTAGFLLDSMFDFADRFSKLNLTEEELALFSSIILLAPDRPGLRNIEQVERIQNKLTQALQNMINSIHMGDSTLFAKLLMKTTDLRTLNTLHSEKLIGPQSKESVRTEDLYQIKQEQVPMETESSGNEMLLNYGSPPAMAMPGHPMERPNADLNMGGSTVPVVPQRMNMEGNNHQKLVLQTPYGTFYREEVSGFYGYLPDQPRQRCHTLDRDTMSRPSRSLHVIDEGNRRRYTLDKEYISKMVNKLSHKLEKRAAINDDYNPPSVTSSACSSPVPDDHYNLVSSRDFLPVGSTPDSSACSSRTSPVPGKDRYSPGSPNPRSRSGSMAEKDYSEIRRRCYSFHINSEGRAARNLHPTALPVDSDRISLDSVQPAYSTDTRRGSVGASYGIHRHEKALLMDRGAHLLQNPDLFYRGLGKRLSKEDLSKFHRVEHSASLMAPMPIKQLSPSPQGLSMSPPALPKVCPMEKVQSPKGDMPKLSWMAQDGSRGIENVSPPLLDTAPVEERGPTTSNPDTRILISDFSCPNTSVVHKKFDKFRKTAPQSPPSSTHVEKQQRASPGETSGQPMSMESRSPRAGSPPEVEKASKPSAAQAHPQLMAHLNAPPPAMVTTFPMAIPTTMGSQISLPQSRPTQLVTEPQVVMTTTNPKPIVSSNNTMIGSNHNGSKQLTEADEKSMRNHVHATTMSSLKDKLLKRIDSMDNLVKIGNGNATDISGGQRDSVKLAPGPTVTLGPNTTSVMTTQPPHNMYAPSPMYTHPMSMYPPYYGLRYPAVPGMAVMPQPPYGQALPGMPHMAQMYNGPLPGHHRPDGQPLNLTKRLEDMSQMGRGQHILLVSENGIKTKTQGPQLLFKEEPAV